GGQFVPGRQCDDQIAMTQPAACHDQTVIRGARKGGDGALDLAGVARMDRAQLDPPSDGATESPAIPAVSIARVDYARAPASPRPRDRSRIAAACPRDRVPCRTVPAEAPSRRTFRAQCAPDTCPCPAPRSPSPAAHYAPPASKACPLPPSV